MDKVTRQRPQITTFLKRREPKRYRTEVLPITTRPSRLTGEVRGRDLLINLYRLSDIFAVRSCVKVEVAVLGSRP